MGSGGVVVIQFHYDGGTCACLLSRDTTYLLRSPIFVEVRFEDTLICHMWNTMTSFSLTVAFKFKYHPILLPHSLFDSNMQISLVYYTGKGYQDRSITLYHLSISSMPKCFPTLHFENFHNIRYASVIWFTFVIGHI